jgi:hypothetical protein
MATTIVPFRSTSEQATSRPAMLGRLATGATVVALPATAFAADAPDPHFAWFAEWQRLIDWCNGPEPGARDMQDCPEWHRSLELEELIGATPARTLAGAFCQLRIMRQWCTKESLPNDACDAALTNAMATVERLAGGQADA